MIHLVGDSQAEGLAPFFRAAGAAVSDHRGYSTRRLRDEVLPTLRIAPGDTVVVVTGGNDDPDSAQLPEIVRSTAERLERAVGSSGRVFWVGPVFARVLPDATVHPRTAAVHRAAVAGKARVSWIDAQPLTRDLARSTNVHLDAAGYREYAERLMRAMQSSGSGLALFALVSLAVAIATRKWWIAALPP
jgi:hypothetical protein